MAENRQHPVLAPLRTTHTERALIDMVATTMGTSTAALLRSIVIPEISRRAHELAAQVEPTAS